MLHQATELNDQFLSDRQRYDRRRRRHAGKSYEVIYNHLENYKRRLKQMSFTNVSHLDVYEWSRLMLWVTLHVGGNRKSTRAGVGTILASIPKTNPGVHI